MRRAVPALLAAAGLLLPAAELVRADVVVLTDGKRLEGKVLEETDEHVVIETTFQGTRTVPRAKVRSVDTSTPPLREQLAARAREADGDPASLWELHGWARRQGFKEELGEIARRVVELDPGHARARRALGHERVGGQWVSPEEKAEKARLEEEAAMRAQGLVPHEGRWVTPEEKDALERGLRRDGDDWVTEEEWHRRRGEERVGDAWVRMGEKEGQAWATEASAGARIPLQYLWGPHFDVVHDLEPDLARRALDASEAAWVAMRRLLRPQGKDLPETAGERIRLVLFKRPPAYTRFAQWFGERYRCDDVAPGWSKAVVRQHSFWWTHPERVVGVYQFPNTDKTFTSNVVHDVGLVLLTRYRLNFQFSSVWLREGFAYHLEMETLGYSQSFTLGRGGTAGGAGGEPPPWVDSERWRKTLAFAVGDQSDPPLRRLAAMTMDQFGYAELVKSWSVVEYLARWDPAKFKAFVDATKRSGVTEEEALREVYGVDYRELDERWRAWVAGGFRAP
jgi:hypothetical protein